jgi:hypothetical protein
VPFPSASTTCSACWRNQVVEVLRLWDRNSTAEARRAPVPELGGPQSAPVARAADASRPQRLTAYLAVTVRVAEPPRLLLTVMLWGLVEAANVPAPPDSVPSSAPVEVT